MDDARAAAGAPAKRHIYLRQIAAWFASTKLAVLLLVVISAVLAGATLLEAGRGREYAQWYVYKNPWFMALLGLLALNIFAATLSRFPWRRGKRAFVLTHVGVLVVLAGALITYVAGVEGQLAVQEGQFGDTAVLTDQCQLTTVWGRHENQPPSAFIFERGPTDWPEGQTLDLGSLGGVQLKVLKFLRHARVRDVWVADSSSNGRPALQLALVSPDGTPMIQQWFVAEPFADEAYLGMAKIAFQQAPAASMLADFTDPPKDDTDTDGTLSLHYQGQMDRIPVRANVGKRVTVGKSDIGVEITSYLPDAKPDAAAHFTTASQQPNNPVLELKVYMPGRKEPLRQLAFAKHPYLSLDGIHGWNCPVKFYYHHPSVPPQPGTQFLQTPDGKLHYRVVADGKLVAHGEVREGTKIGSTAQLSLSVLNYLPHARQEISFLPADRPNEDAEEAPAVLVGVKAGGETSEVWLRQADPDYGFQQIVTPEGALGIAFGYERMPLGFALKLVRFRHELNPGMMGDAAFGSDVRVIDKNRGVDAAAEIAMNQPLVYGGFTFYQSSHAEMPDGQSVSILTVATDPGRFLKYLGSLMVCLGVFAVFYPKALPFIFAPLASLKALAPRRRSIVSNTQAKTVVLALLLVAGGTAIALGAGDDVAFDWRQWQSLPVQADGRQKPLDTLAGETIRTISDKSSFTDPQTQQKLGPTGLYLALLFTGQCWNRPASAHGMPDMSACPAQSAATARRVGPRAAVVGRLRRAAHGAGNAARSALHLLLRSWPRGHRRPEDGPKDWLRRLDERAPAREATDSQPVGKKRPCPGPALLGLPGDPPRAEA